MNFDVKVFKNWRVYASFMAVAAILPVVLAGMIMPGRLNLGTTASAPAALRVWLTPNEVSMRVGQKASLAVMAEYEDPVRALPGVTVGIVAPAGVSLSAAEIKYQQAFTGVTKIGNVTATARDTGVYSIEIPVGEVKISIGDTPVISTSAKITVK